MVLAKEDNLVYGFRLSSVGSGKITLPDTVHEPSGIDLAMKLHYLRGVYFFSSETAAAAGLSTVVLKESIFQWLVAHWRVLGRFRRSESSGRPYIKCNDCGARFIEAQSDKTLEEWLAMDWSLHKLLVSNQIIGPELFFSPPVLFQLTRLKCGGVSIGLSWSHVMGDAIAASEYFFNGLSRTMSGKEPSSIPYSETPKPNIQNLKQPSPLALKKVDSVGDHWITPNYHKMETFSFIITPTQLNSLEVKLLCQDTNPAEEIPTFELICGVIWQCVAKVRQGSSEPKLVTICRKGTKRAAAVWGNNQIISTVEAVDVANMDPKSLAAMLANLDVSYEQTHIGEVVESDNGASDYIVYGANLTFVNWEDADFYGFEPRGHKPVCVSYTIQGVGDAGAVLVLPRPNGEGRLVNIILPEKEVLGLKAELRKNDLILEIN
ncbi:protein ECERIFERUM 26-like [Argentina anserina]|uniref:protein ECERIFERUM 26-like n=1 Tax=Argentina anserina TaxID=57926 RepID=UPI00217679E4|nr:protein ECERIFERUM 26-like [Potentilla anserina]